MSDIIPQFGQTPSQEYRDRPSAYAVVFNNEGNLLVLTLSGEYHLPGGGIEANEVPILAITREAFEEAGAKISNLTYIGRANQFIEDDLYGSVNKLGTFYKADLASYNPELSTEADHVSSWISLEEYLSNPLSAEFQKWAVQQVTR
jgi:8-oxo-dGTP pyrophosphatase MutT (NUDIX family)